MLERFLTFAALSFLFSSANSAEESTDDREMPLIALGQALFFDTNLSLRRNQACATCHEPGRAYADGRENGVAGAVSLGDDRVSLGDRNAPSISYANQVPDFHISDRGEIVGGLFLDGRSATMDAQAREPFLNPIEMAMPDRASVVGRAHENSAYASSFRSLFGQDLFADTDRAFDAIATSVVAFERSSAFSPFDSKYDRYVRGEYAMTKEEEVGRLLFFSQLIGCHNCHLLDARESQPNEMFTNHKYHNIGVPVNERVRAINGVKEKDVGLFANPDVDDAAQSGKFRVPSLRNVAVTGPYMHNGVFQELETAILFYDKYLLNSAASNTNPETGEAWGEPEIVVNIDLDLLQQGQPITARRAIALAAFLRTLTDKRYEALLID